MSHRSVMAAPRRMSIPIIQKEIVQDNPYMVTVPGIDSWYGILCMRQGEQKIKALYVSELSSLMVVHALIAGFTFQPLWTDIEMDNEVLKVVLKISMYVSFLTAVISIFFCVTQLAQLNIRIAPYTVTKFFTSPKTSHLPLYSAILMIVTITSVLLTAFILVISFESQLVAIVVLLYGGFLYAWVFRCYTTMNSVVLAEFKDMKNDIISSKTTKMFEWFQSKDLGLFHAEIVAQEIYTLDELRNVISLMSLADFASTFQVSIGAAAIIYSLKAELFESKEPHSFDSIGLEAPVSLDFNNNKSRTFSGRVPNPRIPSERVVPTTLSQYGANDEPHRAPSPIAEKEMGDGDNELDSVED